MKKPKRKRKKHGSYVELASRATYAYTSGLTYLKELPPIKEMTGIVLENKNVIDLMIMPDSTVEAKQNKQEVHQQVAGIYL
jgi:hypothetical protein